MQEYKCNELTALLVMEIMKRIMDALGQDTSDSRHKVNACELCSPCTLYEYYISYHIPHNVARMYILSVG